MTSFIPSFIRYIVAGLLTAALALSSLPAYSWDSVGHRLSAAIATHYMSDELKSDLHEILKQHPRYQQDFLNQLPDSIAGDGFDEQFEWLLGQAAFWPDIARGLPTGDREKYNRANWHYIDGAWLRGQANIQGNSYIGKAPLPDIAGQFVSDATSAGNVMNALDANTALLADTETPGPQRAVALCWILHLVGDIHQPLHVGSLYSKNQFANGDRGGNGIATDGGNLHARWDRALRSEGVKPSRDTVLEQFGETLQSMVYQDAADWSLWMHESRALLLNTVYTEEMKSAIIRADNSGTALREFTLNSNYVETMKHHSRMRLALAGRRLALWLDGNL